MILYVDTKILKNNVNPSIKESKKKLNSAKGIVSKIKVPEGFASTNKLKKSIPKRITDVDTDMGDLYKFVSKKIDSFTNAGKNIISMGKTNLLKFGVKITASSVNECLSLVKGLGNFAESLLDTGATIAAVGVTPIAGLSDLINYLTGNEVSAVDELWRGTKGLIANEVVNSAFKDLYENYEFGKWLDENAFKPYKSTGAIPRLTEGIGELAGTALLTLFTAGAGAAANPATASKLFTLLRGLTGAGKAFQDYWSDSSGDLEGKENLVDTLKGLGYGTLTGGWESLQAYIGGDTLKGIQVLKNQFLNSLVRIGIDTGFNMADTPYRSLMDVIFKGKEWNEAWKDQGGWTSLLINGGIGFIGSTFGEVLDYKNTRNNQFNSLADNEDSMDGFFTQESIFGNNKDVFENRYNYKMLRAYEEAGMDNNFLYMKNPEDKGLIINEISKYYSIDDISRMSDYQINEIVIQAKKDATTNLIIDYCSTRKKYFSIDEIEYGINNRMIIHKDLEELQLDWLKRQGYSAEAQNKYKLVGGFCNAFGELHLPPDTPIRTMAHEFNHSKGTVKYYFRQNEADIGIDEALTELLAIKMTGSPNNSGYNKSVEVLNKIINKLDESGYIDVDYHTYFGKDRELLKNILDKNCSWVDSKGVTQSFYDNLTYYMQQYNETFNAPDIKKQAGINLDRFLEYFEQCDISKKSIFKNILKK